LICAALAADVPMTAIAEAMAKTTFAFFNPCPLVIQSRPAREFGANPTEEERWLSQ
jgi:hypothetical protein